MSKIKKLIVRLNKGALSTMAAMALMVTVANVNSCCWFILGQDELPANTKKLSRFK